MKSLVLSVACLFGFVGYANATDCHANVVERVEFVTDYVPVQEILFLNHANFSNVDYNVQRNFVRVVRDRNVNAVKVQKVVNREVVVKNRVGFLNRFRAAAQALTQRNVQRNVEVKVETVRVRNIRSH